MNILYPPAESGRSGWRVDERVRMSAIAEHDIERLRDDATLTRITDFAAALCETPVALVSIVEENRQTFLSRTGLATTETPREQSFCAHAMLEDEVMVVPDATLDPRFADNPLVVGDMGVRFYAGAPLIRDDGVTLGSLCVIDTVPRAGLTKIQLQGLRVLAADVMMRLSDSRASAASRTAINDSEGRFRTLADTMPQMVWSTLPDGFHDYYNARWYEFTGVPDGSTDGEAWNGVFHPHDQDRAWAVWRHSLETGEPYQIEYRLRRHDGQYRWTLGRALPIRDKDGTIVRWFGTCTDIHEQKEASEEREIISQELSHRIKNIFAVISGLIAFSARANPGFKPIADDLRARVTALGRAHDFVRPHSAQSRPAAAQTSLHGLLGELFLPVSAAGRGADYGRGGGGRDRRSLRNADRVAVPRTCHQRDQIRGIGKRYRCDHGVGHQRAGRCRARLVRTRRAARHCAVDGRVRIATDRTERGSSTGWRSRSPLGPGRLADRDYDSENCAQPDRRLGEREEILMRCGFGAERLRSRPLPPPGSPPP